MQRLLFRVANRCRTGAVAGGSGGFNGFLGVNASGGGATNGLLTGVNVLCGDSRVLNGGRAGGSLSHDTSSGCGDEFAADGACDDGERDRARFRGVESCDVGRDGDNDRSDRKLEYHDGGATGGGFGDAGFGIGFGGGRGIGGAGAIGGFGRVWKKRFTARVIERRWFARTSVGGSIFARTQPERR
jgi:hypothetical protein